MLCNMRPRALIYFEEDVCWHAFEEVCNISKLSVCLTFTYEGYLSAKLSLVSVGLHLWMTGLNVKVFSIPTSSVS